MSAEALLERPSQELADDPIRPVGHVDYQPSLIDADTIPEIQQARYRARQEAEAKMDRNRELVASGQSEMTPIEVDVLGTARLLVDIGKIYGKDSPQYKELDTGLELDCERVIGEAERRWTFEYFGDARQERNQATGHYRANGVNMPDVLESGLSALTGSEQQDLRVNDFVGEVGGFTEVGRLMRGIGKAALGKTVNVLSVEECPSEIIEEYEADKQLGLHAQKSYRGYVPQINKFMIGDMQFKRGADHRNQRRLALSGEYIDHDVITTVLTNLNVLEEGEQLTRTEVHGKQFIGNEQQDSIWLAKQLDAEASLRHGKRIFMGEAVDDDHPMDYDSIPAEAEARRVKLAPKPRELANYLVKIQEAGVTPEAAEGMVNSYLKEMLLKVARSDPDKAEMMFDKKTADGFRMVAHLEALGLDDDADRLRIEVEKNAPDVSYCGAGSCRLVFAGLREVLIARTVGLTGEITHNQDLACIDCGSRSVVHGENGKACTACGISEVDGVMHSAPDRKAEQN